jgi:hypothetical protein
MTKAKDRAFIGCFMSRGTFVSLHGWDLKLSDFIVQDLLYVSCWLPEVSYPLEMGTSALHQDETCSSLEIGRKGNHVHI